jgi:hypothetical protein
MKLLTASLAALAFIAAPALAQQSNSMTAEHNTNVHTTTATEHVHGTVPVTHHHRVVHHRHIVRHHHPMRHHHMVRHHHHVVKKTTVTTTAH